MTLHTPATPDPERRARYAAAARTVRLHLGPNAIAQAQRGEPIILSGTEADAIADAVTPVADAELHQQAQQLTTRHPPADET